MSKYVNIAVSTNISTDFFIEVPDDISENDIKELAMKEVTLPHKYPEILDNILKTKMGIQITGLDSMLKSWNIGEIHYNIKN